MTIEALGAISSIMDELNLPYEFQRWKGDIPDMYFVGDYTEVDGMNFEECGECESTFFLDGYSTGSVLSLESAKNTIKNTFPKQVITETGSVVAFFYGTGRQLRTGNDAINHMQITIKVKEWRN